MIQLYFTSTELKAALDDLGPPGNRAEATVKAAVLAFADLIEADARWEVSTAADPAAALMAGLPMVSVFRVDLPTIEDDFA